MTDNQWYNTPAGIMVKTGQDQHNLYFFDEAVDFEIDECTLIEKPANPLAPQMLQAAYDVFEHEKWWELWEYRQHSWPFDAWRECSRNTMWLANCDYHRIEPKKIFMCNGVEVVDDRLTEALEEHKGLRGWVVELTREALVDDYSWVDDLTIKRGLAHHTKEGAIAHARALLGEG